jgi:hypothetical protein
MKVLINGTTYDAQIIFEWEVGGNWKEQGWYFRPDERTGYVGAYPTQIAMITAINEVFSNLFEVCDD